MRGIVISLVVIQVALFTGVVEKGGSSPCEIKKKLWELLSPL